MSNHHFDYGIDPHDETPDETPYEFGQRLGRVFAAPYVDAIKSAGNAAYAAGFASGAAAQRAADAAVCRELASAQYMRTWEDMSEGFTRADEDRNAAAAILAAPLAQPGATAVETKG